MNIKQSVFCIFGGALLASALSARQQALAAPTAAEPWQPRGIGGGGALYAPAFSPHHPDDLFIACDMGEYFRSKDFGRSWRSLPAAHLVGSRDLAIAFTGDPQRLYAINAGAVDGVDRRRPFVSTDGGATWRALKADPTEGEAIALFADAAAGDRIVLSDYRRVFLSTDEGNSFRLVHSTAARDSGVHVGAVLFDGPRIVIVTSDGALVSTDDGATFPTRWTDGWPENLRLVRAAAVRGTSGVFLYAIAAKSMWAGIPAEDLFGAPQEVYVLRESNGSGQWKRATPPANLGAGEGISQIVASPAAPQTVYLGGQTDNERPRILRSDDAGASWRSVLTPEGNGNVATGWAGARGDREWTYGAGALGLGISPRDPARLAFTDLGFVHVTRDGGASWNAAYTGAPAPHAPGKPTPTRLSYASIGLENTSCWRVVWLDQHTLWACFSDIRGLRSTDSGATWGFTYSGHSLNTSYDCVVAEQPSRVAYLATSSVHDLYKTTYLTNERIDRGKGGVLLSTDAGATWTSMKDFARPVYALALDPRNPDRLFALVVHSADGGIYETRERTKGSAATWRRLAVPPRTEGHPYCLRVLNDGALLATYTGRRAGRAFTGSAGVFLSTDDGATWTDVSAPEMHYYTKDLTLDPADPTQSTWYVGVWSGWNGPQETNNNAGGLYRTRDRGKTWSRIWKKHRVSSCDVDPADANHAWISTETDGLWETHTLRSEAPAFTRVDDFPFHHPEHVQVRKTQAGTTELWASSFGNGMRVKTLPASAR